MLNHIQYFLLGLLSCFIYILFFFGTNIKAKSNPKVKINIPPLIVDSHIMLFGYHIHHWLISMILLIIMGIIYFLVNFKRNSYVLNTIVFFTGFFLLFMFHGLLYPDCFKF